MKLISQRLKAQIQCIMDNNRFLKAIIGVLLLLNIAILLFFSLNRLQKPEPPFEYLMRELDLSAEQRTKYLQIHEEHTAQIRLSRAKVEVLHQQYFHWMASPETDSLKLQVVLDSVAALRVLEEQITFHHFKAVRGLCTPEQAQRFDAIISEVWQRLKQRPPPHKRKN